MNFTKEQLSDVFVKHLNREKGLQELKELTIESMSNWPAAFIARD